MRRFPLPVLAVVLLARSLDAQPTLEDTACLHPNDQHLDGLGLTLAAADWNEDGRDELAYGAPFWDDENPGGLTNGSFASYTYLGFGGEDEWDRVGGVYGPEGSRWGHAIVAGDFDGDGVLEFSFSAPYSGGGSVNVFEIRDDICCYDVNDPLRQGEAGIAGSSEVDDEFGWALAAGDFDDDGFDDLAVGVPGESWSGVDGTKQGAVHVFFGSAEGLDGARDLLFGQNEFSGQTRESLDQFGQSLAAGDLDGDGYADLVIGAPHENEGAVADSGIVHVVFGGESGLDFTRQQDWTQSSSGISSSPEESDLFGWSLAVGDFDRASITPIRQDLAISAPCEADDTIGCAGAVHVLYSGANGPTSAGSQFFLRPGGSQLDAAFGNTLYAADLDADEAADLVVSTPTPAYTPPPGIAGNGEVNLYFGFDRQKDPAGPALRHSGLPAWVPSDGACIDLGLAAYDFGEALTSGDFDDDGRIDLAIGIKGWTDDLADTFKGAAQILFGSRAIFRDGFDTGDSGRWSAAN